MGSLTTGLPSGSGRWTWPALPSTWSSSGTQSGTTCNHSLTSQLTQNTVPCYGPAIPYRYFDAFSYEFFMNFGSKKKKLCPGVKFLYLNFLYWIISHFSPNKFRALLVLVSSPIASSFLLRFFLAPPPLGQCPAL